MEFNPVPKGKNYCRCGCGEVIPATKKWVSGHNLKRRSKDAIVKKGRLYKEIECTECGNNYVKRADSIGKVNTCGPSCYSSYLTKAKKGVKLKKKGEYRNCKVCGEEFYLFQSRIKKNARFCSDECRFKNQKDLGIVPKEFLMSANNKGKNNGRYKHGNRTGAHVNNKKVREEVVEQEGGYWCMKCGTPQQGLHLHRIKYASQGGKYETDNCVLLCPEHHGEVHSNKNKWLPILQEHVKKRKESYAERT